jgi:hypothetical protein
MMSLNWCDWPSCFFFFFSTLAVTHGSGRGALLATAPLSGKETQVGVGSDVLWSVSPGPPKLTSFSLGPAKNQTPFVTQTPLGANPAWCKPRESADHMQDAQAGLELSRSGN